MPIQRLHNDAVDVVCLCGAMGTYPITAFRADVTQVVFPTCRTCGQGLGTTFLPREVPADLTPDQRARTLAAFAIARTVGGQGLAWPAQADGLAWPEPRAVVEVPLHPTYVKAAAAWQAAHPAA
jgi:hypothetical protein